jgi:flagellar biosynthesis protein FlhA
MNLEIGYNLIPLVDKEQGGDLLDRIKLIRRRIGLDMGILVPPIRIIDNVGIDASEYILKIRGSEVSKGKIYINRFLAMNPKLDLKSIEGVEVKEPAFGLDAKWISNEERSKAESLGFDIFDPPSVIATHITEIIKKNAGELLTRQDVKSMIDALQKEYPVVTEEALKNSSVGEIQKVLQNLLKEGVRIRNMLTILETISDYGSSIKNIDLITEYVRQSLGKQIASSYADETNTLKAIVIDPEVEQIFTDSIHETAQGLVSTLEPDLVNKFITGASQVIDGVIKTGRQPVILSSQKIRRLVRELIERSFPGIGVLSYSEIPTNYSLDQIGIISIN